MKVLRKMWNRSFNSERIHLNLDKLQVMFIFKEKSILPMLFDVTGFSPSPKYLATWKQELCDPCWEVLAYPWKHILEYVDASCCQEATN